MHIWPEFITSLASFPSPEAVYHGVHMAPSLEVPHNSAPPVRTRLGPCMDTAGQVNKYSVYKSNYDPQDRSCVCSEKC